MRLNAMARTPNCLNQALSREECQIDMYWNTESFFLNKKLCFGQNILFKVQTHFWTLEGLWLPFGNHWDRGYEIWYITVNSKLCKILHQIHQLEVCLCICLCVSNRRNCFNRSDIQLFSMNYDILDIKYR